MSDNLTCSYSSKSTSGNVSFGVDTASAPRIFLLMNADDIIVAVIISPSKSIVVVLALLDIPAF